MRRGTALLASLGLLAASGAGALWLADRAVGRLIDPRFAPLAGEPGTRSTLARSEFRVVVRTNEAGFRGGPLPGSKEPGTYRIVVLGDSFTWGYGVRERQAYPARLERRLNERRGGGRRIEVVNLGLPGTGPLDYLHHLAHTGLALDPDVVVVGVFANDVNDLYQVRRFGARSPLFALPDVRSGGGPRPWWRRTADAALPNLYALAGRAMGRLAPGPREARAAGEEGAAPAVVDPRAVLAALGKRYGRRDALLARHAVLPRAERAAVDRLLRGEPLGEDVRPAILLSALLDPDAEADGILLRSAGRRGALEETADVLAEIVRRARRQGAATVLAVLPASEQIDRARWPVLEDAGFRLDPAMLTDTTLPDTVCAVAARERATCVDLVAAFRHHRGAALYYHDDEHWNARGQAYAAARLADAIESVLPPTDPRTRGGTPPRRPLRGDGLGDDARTPNRRAARAAEGSPPASEQR